MLKVMIVDDELPIREWLSYALQKSGLPVEVCSLCGNGCEAMEVFENQHPDLIFTDIKMPGMDGIQLLQQVRARDPNVYVVMLTSHDNFEYVRRSLKYSANEYILKTEISSDTLKRVYGACMEQRESVRRSPAEEAATVPLQKLLLSFSEYRNDPERFCAQLPHHIHMKDFSQYFVVAVSLADVDQEQIWRSELMQLNEKENVKITPFYYDGSCMIVLVSLIDNVSVAKLRTDRSVLAKKLLGVLECTIGLSRIHFGLNDFPDAVQMAIQVLEQKFFHETRTCILMEEALNPEKEAAFRVQIKSILQKISGRRIMEASSQVRELMEDLESYAGAGPQLIRRNLGKIITAFQVIALSREMETTAAVCIQKQKEIELSRTLRIIRSEMLEMLDQVEEELGEREFSRHIQQAISIIHQDYARIRRIADVSDRIGLNTEYFCRVFKQETGLTFNNYLTNFRVNTAKKLLQNTDMKIVEIGEAVGYPNLSYFSRVFKITTGMSPFRYRDQADDSPSAGL